MAETERSPWIPEYGIGDVLDYIDNHKRPQTGEITSIEVKQYAWPERKASGPHVYYTVRHPSYRHGRTTVGVRDIVRVRDQPDDFI